MCNDQLIKMLNKTLEDKGKEIAEKRKQLKAAEENYKIMATETADQIAKLKYSK